MNYQFLSFLINKFYFLTLWWYQTIQFTIHQRTLLLFKLWVMQFRMRLNRWVLVWFCFSLFIFEQKDLARVLLIWLENKLFPRWPIQFTMLRRKRSLKIFLQRGFINFTFSLNLVTRLQRTWELVYLRFAFFPSAFIHQLIIYFLSKIWESEWFLNNLRRQCSKRTSAFIRLHLNIYVF
jgi:hypothetical protein